MIMKVFKNYGTGLQSHLFLHLHLAAYIHGKTMVSEYCICASQKIRQNRKKKFLI